MTHIRPPSLLDALIPVASLVIMLYMSVLLFGDESSQGPNQIVLTLGAAIGVMVAMKNGFGAIFNNIVGTVLFEA